MIPPLYEVIIVIGAIIVVFGVVGLAIFYAFGSINSEDLIQYDYNVTKMMRSDNWTCGYIYANTTLEDVRNCFR